MTAAPTDPAGLARPDRRQRRTARTRAGIEAAALRLFSEQGFDATTVEQIADASDIAPRTFFRHFPNKEAVLFGDQAREIERMCTVLAARPADEHPMRSLATALLDAAERIEPDREQHLVRARLLDTLACKGDYEVQLFRQRWWQDVTQVIAARQGLDTSQDHRPNMWSMVLMSCFASAMHAWLVCTDGTPLRRFLADVLDECGAGLDEAAEQTRVPTPVS